MEVIYGVARDFGVPVLIHFEHGRFATGFERFSRVVDKYPTVQFIGHAQAWWGNIDLRHVQENLYPTGPVTPGVLTDRLLSECPNVYADLSAASGFRALARDRSHTRDFLTRHQNKLLFGSDCEHQDAGGGSTCWCSLTLRILRSLGVPLAVSKILQGNARRVLKLPIQPDT